MKIYRGPYKTTKAVEAAAAEQDAGREVIFIVPEAKWVNHLYPLFVETLDMSRVMIYTQGQVNLTRGTLASIIVEDLHLWNFEHVQELYSLPVVFATSR